MAKGHRAQIKRERNANKDTRPSAKLSYARVSVTKACFVLDAIRGKNLDEAFGLIETVEKAAQLYMLTYHKPRVNTITDEQLVAVAEHFGLNYRKDFLNI